MWVRYLCFSVFLCLSLNKTFAQNGEIAATLLEAYGNRCPHTIGPFNAPAFVEFNSLVNVTKKVFDNPECSAVAYNMDQLNIFADELNQYYSLKKEEKYKSELEKKKAFYTSALIDLDPNNSELENFITSELLTLEASIISSESSISFYGSPEDAYHKVARSTVAGIDQLFRQLQANPNCAVNAEQHIGPALGSLVGTAFLATTPFLGPGAAVAGQAGNVLVRSLTELTRIYSYNQRVQALDKLQMSLAMRCTVEAVTTSYCESKDTLELIEIVDEEQGLANSKLKGVELTRVLKNLGDWLELMYAGSPVTSEQDFNRRVKPIRDLNHLEIVEMSIQAFDSFEEHRGQLARFTVGHPDYNQAIRKGIDVLVCLMGVPHLEFCKSGGENSGSSGSNPIFENRDRHLTEFQLLDPRLNTIPQREACGQTGEGNCTLLEFITHQGTDNETWNLAVRRAKRIVDQEQVFANSQIVRTKSQNPVHDLSQVYVKNFQDSPSAMETLYKIRETTTELANYFLSLTQQNKRRYKAYYNASLETIEVTEKIINLAEQGLNIRQSGDIILPEECLEEPEPEKEEEKEKTCLKLGGEIKSLGFNSYCEENSSPKEKSLQISGCISQILNLSEGGGVDNYFSQLRSNAQFELDSRLREKEFGEKQEVIIRSLRRDLLRSITRTYGEDGSISEDSVKRQLVDNMGLLRDTLNQFFSYFGKAIKNTMKSFRLENKHDRQNLTFLCMMGKAYVEEPNKQWFKFESLKKQDFHQFLEKNCSGITLVSNRHDPESPVLRWNELVNKKEEDKICGLWDFYRSERLRRDERAKEL